MTPMASGNASIVGGGIAGLIAAVGLARAGVAVRLFESAAEFGGRARTRQAGGFFLNQGPHALYSGAFQHELTRLGISFSGRPSQPAAPQVLWRGKLYPLPISMVSLAATNLFGIGDKVSFARVQKAILDGAASKDSFAVWLDGQKLSPIVRATLEALGRVTSYANAPADVLASAMLDQMRLGLKGVLYIDGGWASLISGLRDAAFAAGAMLNTGAAVARVAVEGRKTRITLADGAQHVADATLLAVGPREATVLAPSIASLASAARDALPIRAHTLDLALRQMPERSQAFVLGVDQPVYFSVHSVAAKLAPDGGAVVHLAKYLPIDEQPSPDAMGELEAIADLAMPGWRKFEVKRQELYAMVVANGVVRPDQSRPSVALPDAPGVFIAGDWVGEEGMIADAAAASAAKAVSSVLKWLSANPANQSAA